MFKANIWQLAKNVFFSTSIVVECRVVHASLAKKATSAASPEINYRVALTPTIPLEGWHSGISASRPTPLLIPLDAS